MNIFQKAITPDKPRVLEGEQIYVYVPQATSTNAGIAGYTSRDFNVNNSIVSLKWPIESKIQGPLNTASLVKVDSSEFENTNENIITEYEGNAIMSQTGIRLIRTERDAYNRPDFVMLDSDYFPRELIDKNGQKFYKYTTSAVHYIVQNLTDAQKMQARENINAGSLHAVEIANSKADNAVATAISAKDLALEALDTAGEADNTAKEALRYVQEEVGTQITVGEDFVRTLLFTSDPQEQINSKANTEYVNTELAKKANAENVNTELAKKADTTYVDAELDKRAGINYVNAELSKKANTEYVNTELAKKADSDYVNTELAKKSDITYVDQKIADLVGSAPDALDTLDELAGALKDNKDIVTVLENAIATKANASDLNNYVPLTGNSTINGNLTVGIVQAHLFSTNGDVQAGYLQAKSAGHETGTYEKIATLSSTGYIRYRTLAEMKSDLGVPTNYVTTDGTEQTISGTKKFTANNNTFTRTLVLGAATPINFTGMGNGTYNIGAFVCNNVDKFGVECPRESDSGSAAIVPFRIGARGGQLGILQAGDMYQNGYRVVDVGSAQKIEGAKYFTGQVGNEQTEAGVYLGLDKNTGAENANMAIVSANTAAYIDMGRPNVDYDFRIIKWNQPGNTYAQLVYAGNASGTITIPQASGTMALTHQIPAEYVKSAVISNGAIVLTKQDNTTVSFAGSGISLNQWRLTETSDRLVFTLV